MQIRLERDEEKKQKQNEGNAPRRATGSVDGAWLRPWNWKTELGAGGEPVNCNDQKQRRNHKQSL